ncbi:hypothetical protein Tco_0850074 [Tanacetum coccineum]
MDEEFTTTAYPNVQENLKLPTEDQVILEEPVSSTGTLSSLKNLDKDLSFTDQVFVEKPHEEASGETNVETEVQSMVSVPIHQDTSSVPPMTLRLIGSHDYAHRSLPTSTTTTSIITTTTAIPPNTLNHKTTSTTILDLPTVDMKEILQQRMFEDDSYKAHYHYQGTSGASGVILSCRHLTVLLSSFGTFGAAQHRQF